MWLFTDHCFEYEREGIPHRDELEDTIEDELLAEIYAYAEREGIKDGRIEIFDDLYRMYEEWLQPGITSVCILQKDETVYLEITRDTGSEYTKDEGVERIDLCFIDGKDGDMFPYRNGAEVNAKKFLKEMDPYSIINCTSLFTEEAGDKIWKAHVAAQEIPVLKREKAIRHLMKHIQRDTLMEVFEFARINGEPDKWMELHFSLGTTVRNHLRQSGIEWDDIELDTVWGGLVEEAARRVVASQG